MSMLANEVKDLLLKNIDVIKGENKVLEIHLVETDIILFLSDVEDYTYENWDLWVTLYHIDDDFVDSRRELYNDYYDLYRYELSEILETNANLLGAEIKEFLNLNYDLQVKFMM